MSELEHYDDELFALEERINRLALAGGVDLNENAQITAIIKGQFAFFSNSDEHVYHLLRELLLLRDYITIHCADERGLKECREILEHVDSRLRRNGFS